VSETGTEAHAKGANAAGASGAAVATEAAHGAHLVARGLGRRFGERRALDDVDLEVRPGESFGLLGANGAGKTTFIRLATGYLMPSAGHIEIDGLSPSQDTRRVQARLGYVPETPRLYPELRVRGYLRFVAGLRGLRGPAREAAVDRSLERFQLGEAAARIIGNLSKGFRQRVSLAQAFIHDPALLIIDEPTSGLDPLQRQEVRDLLTGLRGGCTILICTHDLDEARALTSRAAVLRAGRIVGTGVSDELLAGDPGLALFRSSGTTHEGGGGSTDDHDDSEETRP